MSEIRGQGHRHGHDDEDPRFWCTHPPSQSTAYTHTSTFFHHVGKMFIEVPLAQDRWIYAFCCLVSDQRVASLPYLSLSFWLSEMKDTATLALFTQLLFFKQKRSDVPLLKEAAVSIEALCRNFVIDRSASETHFLNTTLGLWTSMYKLHSL